MGAVGMFAFIQMECFLVVMEVTGHGWKFVRKDEGGGGKGLYLHIVKIEIFHLILTSAMLAMVIAAYWRLANSWSCEPKFSTLLCKISKCYQAIWRSKAPCHAWPTDDGLGRSRYAAITIATIVHMFCLLPSCNVYANLKYWFPGWFNVFRSVYPDRNNRVSCKAITQSFMR